MAGPTPGYHQPSIGTHVRTPPYYVPHVDTEVDRQIGADNDKRWPARPVSPLSLQPIGMEKQHGQDAPQPHLHPAKELCMY